MYNLIISLFSGVLFGAGVSFIPRMHWGFAVFIGLIVAIGAMVYLGRRVMKQIEPKFLLAQKQGQARQAKLAIKTLEELLPMGKWQVMLKSQIYAQMGILYFSEKNWPKAQECLEQSNPRITDGQLILAGIYYRQKEMDKLEKLFKIAIRLNKKQVILYNVYAYMLNQNKSKDQALEVLQKCLKANKDNEVAQDNLLRLQNNKKMNMKAFGMTWYSLQIEKPPMSMMQDQFSGRAGFRQKRQKKS